MLYLPILIMIGTGIAIVNTRAWLEAILGIQSSFKRTPKLKIEKNTDVLKERLKYTVPLDFHVVLEFLMGFYCIGTVFLSFALGKPQIVGFLAIYALGFFYVGYLSLKDAFWKLGVSKQESTKELSTQA
ncbi:hypothetical protein LEP1GSC170_2722 [Leptospira interrogans serovar Bataviae str. HAI135]|nr:hypothetical protein LEP1GSC170_2722 [Leptospira interrogans serovar Bataviae str. HAI135]